MLPTTLRVTSLFFIRLDVMKTACHTLLLFFILNPLNAPIERELIGKWLVEEVRMLHPSIGFNPNIIGIQMEFTEGHQFIFKTKSGQMEQHTWFIKRDSILIQCEKNKEPEKWKYTIEGNTLICRVTNITEVTLRRQ